jgi:hypothetical protein
MDATESMAMAQLADQPAAQAERTPQAFHTALLDAAATAQRLFCSGERVLIII